MKSNKPPPPIDIEEKSEKDPTSIELEQESPSHHNMESKQQTLRDTNMQEDIHKT